MLVLLLLLSFATEAAVDFTSLGWEREGEGKGVAPKGGGGST